MKIDKELIGFKVFGITLLMTMSSCVVGSIDLNNEAIRKYVLELEDQVSLSCDNHKKVIKSKAGYPVMITVQKLIRVVRVNLSYVNGIKYLNKVVSFLSNPYSLETNHCYFKHNQSKLTSCFQGALLSYRAGPKKI